jgi:hypothetical protein
VVDLELVELVIVADVTPQSAPIPMMMRCSPRLWPPMRPGCTRRKAKRKT